MHLKVLLECDPMPACIDQKNSRHSTKTFFLQNFQDAAKCQGQAALSLSLSLYCTVCSRATNQLQKDVRFWCNKKIFKSKGRYLYNNTAPYLHTSFDNIDKKSEREREREKWGISLLLYSTKKESGKVCRLVEKKYISQERERARARERENGDVHVTVVAFVFVFIIIMDLYYETSTVTNSSFYNDTNCYFQKYSYLHQY